MKKFLLLLAAVGMIFTACESGGDVEEDNGGTPFVPEITISPDELSFPVEGGEQEVAITANFEYKVSEKADWLSVEQTETGLLVTAKESKNTSERSAYISIINEKYSITKTIDIVQEAWVPKIELAQQSVEAEFEPAQYTVAVTSPYSWEATTKNDWIVVESETGIAGEEKLKFTTLRNEEEKERKGTITLKNSDYNLVAELYITQKAFVPDEMIVEPKSLTFDYKGGTKEVAITANFEYEYSTNADWLTIEKSEKGVNISATPNTKFEECTAEITISNKKYNISKTISVVQKGVSAEAQNVIIYTSYNNKIVTPFESDSFNANIVSNTYRDGQGMIIFDSPVTSIGEEAFYGCTSLTSVTIPDSVTSIESYAFSNCSSLTAFYGKLASADNRCLIIDRVLNSFAPAGLTKYTISNDVTSIGDSAFFYCESLTSVTILDRVTSIGSSAFSYCTSLTTITIPDSVTSIGSFTFYSCHSLTSITIGKGVISIGDYAFCYCTSLQYVYCKPTTPPTGSSTMFYKTAWDRKIYVPRNSVIAYMSAEYWSDYANYITHIHPRV
ncbi:MAG: leucine-rich repeat protein [Alistipes sp.]|nr:leucine-rich repeat protein [Alistipes sp.]